MKKIINTKLAPEPVGPYNQSVAVGNLLFTAGQVAIDPSTNTFIDGDVTAQTHQVIKNLQAVLTAAGSDFTQVVKTTVFLKSMNDYATVNAVYAEYFSENSPARSAVEVSRLPKDALVEIECIAVIPQ